MAIITGLMAAGAPARAQQAVSSPDTVHGLAEVTWGAADGERSFLDGGFGKTAFSGSDERGWQARARLSQAVVEWRPQFSFWASAVVSVQWQDRVHPGLDVDEAYLRLKAPPMGADRLSGRVGLFYPPVSLEHTGPGWTTRDLITASALNSWIGEEVKVAGAEATYSHRFVSGHELAATAAVFGWDDTSGTLLSFRGWALHGLRNGPSTEFELPPLSPFIEARQADETYPMWEIDRRPGYYARLEWRPPAPVSLEALYYDNRGDRTSVRALQWAWQTRFWNLGASWDPTEHTRLRAQALTGHTWMGFATPETWVDVTFRTAYLMATRDVGGGAVSARLDWFDTRDHTWRRIDDNAETGWAATAGWRRPLSRNLDLMLEAQRVSSKRAARVLAGVGPKQSQNVVQSALRLHF